MRWWSGGPPRSRTLRTRWRTPRAQVRGLHTVQEVCLAGHARMLTGCAPHDTIYGRRERGVGGVPGQGGGCGDGAAQAPGHRPQAAGRVHAPVLVRWRGACGGQAARHTLCQWHAHVAAAVLLGAQEPALPRRQGAAGGRAGAARGGLCRGGGRRGARHGPAARRGRRLQLVERLFRGGRVARTP